MSKKKGNRREEKLNSKEVKQEILSFLAKNIYKKYNYRQISQGIKKNRPHEREFILQCLSQLKVDKQIIENDKGKFQINLKNEFAEGNITFTQAGNAYVVIDNVIDNDEIDNGEEGNKNLDLNKNHSVNRNESIFIPKSKTGHAMQNDKVKIILYHKNKKNEGEVIEILERSKKRFVGTLDYDPRKNYAFVMINNSSDLFIPKEHIKKAKNGDKVIAEMIAWPEGEESPIGKVIKTLGRSGENDTEIHAILAEHNLPYNFPKEVEREANGIDQEIRKEEIKNRKDMRSITTFTIDPSDAKDFDDALSIRKLEDDKWEIGIHIADVSYYVFPGTILDEEAYQRATSIYLVDRVVPMLPEILSNKVCSLRPDEEKYTFSAVFEMNNKAEILNQWFGRTVICSNRRFTYEEAQEIIENKQDNQNNQGGFSEEILKLDELAKILRKERERKGALIEEKAEIRFNLDENKDPVSVYFKFSKDSNHLIEEFMLLANRKVSEFVSLNKEGKPSERTFIYRIHDDPNFEKLSQLKQFVKTLGYDLNIDSSRLTQSLNQLLKDIHGKPEENMIEILVMRAMSKARYSTENIGHYGLSFKHYSHFTSPIRRYPDIIAHRLLQDFLDKKPSADKETIENKAKHCSNMEKIAADAERDSIKYMQTKFMEKYIGHKFKGIISGITERGIYVEIMELGTEGLIKLRDINFDHFTFDEKSYSVTGKRTGIVYQLGNEVMIKVVRADVEKRQIDFELIDKLS